MIIEELIALLQQEAEEHGMDAEVRIQVDNCCSHAHGIESVDHAVPRYNGVDTSDEMGMVIIRADT